MKPLPYCTRCQNNNGRRCGICDEADYTDNSGRRQRERAQMAKSTYGHSSPQLIIEICPREPRASIAYLTNGDEVETAPDILQHLEDCNRSGDCEPACRYVLEQIGVEFRIVARNARGKYENRLATADEKADTCRAIYFDSDSDFSDESLAESYLVWEAASHLEG